MTQPKAFTVRLTAEHAALLSQRARQFGNESEAGFIRDLVISELEGKNQPQDEPINEDVLEYLIDLGSRVERLTDRVEALVKEFTHMARWLSAQTKDLPRDQHQEGPGDRPRAVSKKRAGGLSRS
jgi:hypothetical protein